MFELPLICGFKYLLTKNIPNGIAYGLVNGATVILKKIITEELRYEHIKDNKYQITIFPKFLLIEVTNNNKKLFKINGLDENHFLLEPTTVSYYLKINSSKRILIRRIQFPLNLDFAFTAHKLQSLTVEKLIVDLKKPSYKFDHSYTYVVLSRVKKISGLLILRDFEYEMIKLKKHEDLIKEEARLKKLNNINIRNYKNSEFYFLILNSNLIIMAKSSLKKPNNAFHPFCSDQYNKKKFKKYNYVGNYQKLMSEKWKKLKQSQKKVYFDKYRASMVQYNEKLKSNLIRLLKINKKCTCNCHVCGCCKKYNN